MESKMNEEKNRGSSGTDSEKVVELWSRGINKTRTVTVKKLLEVTGRISCGGPKMIYLK